MRFLLHNPTPRATLGRFVRRPVAWVAWALLQSTSLFAQAAQDEGPISLRSSPLLEEQIPQAARSALPTFLYAERMWGRPDLETMLEGNTMLRRGDMVIKADRLEYDQPTDLAKAMGHVRINRAGNTFEGPLLELRIDAFEGYFLTPNYYFLKNDSHGEADRVDFLDEQRAVISNATMTTCRRLPIPNWMPDWILRADRLSMDNEDDVGTAEGAVLSFKGVPLLPIPYLSFPLSGNRKSGVLPPTIGLDNVNGATVTLPYYWNIAPNRDATITPTLMSKRGVNVGTEFRYLESTYAGQLHLDLMPGDQLRDSNRWSLGYQHQATLNNALTRRLTDGGMALNINLNRVSDDDYWRDFTGASTSASASAATSLTQRLLVNDASLSWSNGYFSNTVRTLKWQTLQDVTAPIAQPYDILPQLTTRYTRTNLHGVDYAAVADYSQFQANPLLSVQPNANG